MTGSVGRNKSQIFKITRDFDTISQQKTLKLLIIYKPHSLIYI